MNAWQIALDVRHAQAVDSDARAALQTLIGHLDALMGERQQIAQTLEAFYRAPLSMSSVQPVLDLATQMVPTLTRRDKVLS
jgi:hypothetical protein